MQLNDERVVNILVLSRLTKQNEDRPSSNNWSRSVCSMDMEGESKYKVSHVLTCKSFYSYFDIDFIFIKKPLSCYYIFYCNGSREDLIYTINPFMTEAVII